MPKVTCFLGVLSPRVSKLGRPYELESKLPEGGLYKGFYRELL